jgi:VWFA-related protein
MTALRVLSRACGVGFALIPIVALVAQERSTPPAFKAGTDVVLVDFVVTDKSDRPVKDLTAADFVVKEDGKNRPIVSFAAFAEPDPSPTPAPVAGTAAPARRASGATVLLVDDCHLSAEQTLRLRPDL